MWYGCNRVAPSIAAGRRAPWQARSKGGSAAPARCSHRTQASSARGEGSSGALLASPAGIVSMPAQIALRRRARWAALANHARSLGRRYGGHSRWCSSSSISHGAAHGCLSSVLALVGGGAQAPFTPAAAADRLGGADVGGALLRTPTAARPLAACKVRALPSHGQAGNSGRSAGGSAARRGRVWGAWRQGRALRKM